MKKICLISTYCNTEEKQKILIQNIKKIKSLDLDVMIFTPIPLSNEIYNLCDYVIISKENPVFEWPIKAMWYWKTFTHNDKNIKLNVTIPDYGYANLNQYKRMGSFALEMNYDHFFYMIYDIIIENDIIDVFKNEKESVFFGSIRDNSIWDSGLHLISFDKQTIKKFIDEITIDNYLNFMEDAFNWFKVFVKKTKIKQSELLIKDQIYFDGERDIYSNSPFNYFKCFVHKNDSDNFIKLYFYNLDKLRNIKLDIDGLIIEKQISDWDEILITNINFKKIIVEIDNEIQDMTSSIRSVKYNNLEFI
jgi:hypothetical protein